MSLWSRLSGRWSSLYWIPAGVVFFEFFYSPQIISGRSMQPTLNPDSSRLWRDICLFDRYSIKVKRQYNREDIVAFRAPDDPRRMLVKRIVALEGDTVKARPPYADPVVKIPQGHAWLEGDESFHSDDSNLFGPVPLALIQSKLIFVLWPLERSGFVRRPELGEGASGLARKEAMAAIEREAKRRSRVTITSQESRSS